MIISQTRLSKTELDIVLDIAQKIYDSILNISFEWQWAIRIDYENKKIVFTNCGQVGKKDSIKQEAVLKEHISTHQYLYNTMLVNKYNL